MSFKSKNLTYEQSEPAFLRRLRGEAGGRAEPEGERSAARLSRRGKVESTDDDGPTVVDESNNTLTKDEYESLVSGKAEDSQSGGSGPVETDEGVRTKDHLKEPENVTEAGVNIKKRKAAKVIKADEEDEGNPAGKVDAISKGKTSTTKAKKPRKAVKLSFNAD